MLPIGIMLVGHGTRDETGTAQFFQLGELLSEAVNPMPVVPCLLEFQSPTIPEAWEQLVEFGAEHICVAPLLLFAAGHAKQDIPNLIRECQAKTPRVSVSQTGPLSRHGAVIDLVARRIEQAVGNSLLKNTALVMVGRGSYDPCAQADMRVLTEVVGRRFQFSHLTTAFYAMAEPKLPDVLDQVASRSGIDTVIVQPHLLFEGRLFQAIERQVAEAGERHSSVKFKITGYLGPERNIAKAISSRIESR